MIVYSQNKINMLFKASDLLNGIRDDKKTYFSMPLMAFRNAISCLRTLERYNIIYQKETEVCEEFDSGLREAIEESISIMEFTKERFRNPSEPDIYVYFILLYNYHFRRENT